MGKRIRVQRRGRGSPTFTANTHKRVAPAKIPPFERPYLIGEVVDLVHDPGRGAPLALIRTVERDFYIVAAEGMYVGQKIEIGEGAKVNIGNILFLKDIPDGAIVYNVEKYYGQGGAFARASGAYAIVSQHLPDGKVMVELPSKKIVTVPGNARAIIGVAAGGKRTEKPLLKAGKAFYIAHSKGRYRPIVRGVAMNPVDHPFGGSTHKPKTTARSAPPGRKVGLIAARRTGRKK